MILNHHGCRFIWLECWKMIVYTKRYSEYSEWLAMENIFKNVHAPYDSTTTKIIILSTLVLSIGLQPKSHQKDWNLSRIQIGGLSRLQDSHRNYLYHLHWTLLVQLEAIKIERKSVSCPLTKPIVFEIERYGIGEHIAISQKMTILINRG